MGESGNNGDQKSGKKRTSRDLNVQLGISIGVAILVIILTQNFLFRTPLSTLEDSSLDYRFQARGPLKIPQDSLHVVIVDISEDAIKALPDHYPWPRDYYAHALRNLKRAGVLGVGIDITFDQPDSAHLAGDEAFRKAIRETHLMALAGKTEIETGQYVEKQQDYGNIFYDADSSIGIVFVPSDIEGVLRRYQPMTYDRFSEHFLPSLSFGTLNKAFHQPPTYVPENYPHHFTYAGRTIPKYDETSMLVNYYGPDGTFKHIPFDQVIDDSSFTTTDEMETGQQINLFDDPDIGYLQSGFFKNKIVLIGSRMPEEKDMFTVPIGLGQHAGDNLMYGVEVHANVIEDVLDNNFLTREPQWLDILAILFFSLLTFFGITKFKTLKLRFQAESELLGAGFIFLELGGLAFGSIKLFNSANYVTMVTGPSLAIVLGYVGAMVHNYMTERKQKALIKGMFTQYLNPHVVNELVDHPETLRLGGQRKELTIFFSDIVGFTSISEKLQPEGLVSLLNEYLSAMTDIIFKFEGTLDKFEGDAVMAFWGAPVDQPDHAIRACQASLAMQEELDRMDVLWKSQGKPNLAVRIGLNTGEVLVGNMGGAGRFDYTVIGDSVNLASRLEGANKQYRSKIMMGQTTYKIVAPEVIARELDMIQVVGKTEPVKVYELMGLLSNGMPANLKEFLELYAQGLVLYRQREWEKAIECFENGLKIRPDDYPAQIYIERSRMYQMTPPPEGWNGVFVLRSK
jgi:adenylate cyclase